MIALILAAGLSLTCYTSRAVAPRTASEAVTAFETDTTPDTTPAQTQQVQEQTDFLRRLSELDSQIEKMREDEANTNLYSARTSAETELKLWNRELNAIYEELLKRLGEREAKKLAQEQDQWTRERTALAAENSRRSGDGSGRAGYAAGLVSLTRDRAYELAARLEEAGE